MLSGKKMKVLRILLVLIQIDEHLLIHQLHKMYYDENMQQILQHFLDIRNQNYHDMLSLDGGLNLEMELNGILLMM
jgi:hypothetical protein